jgi:hypothetical protein
VVQSRMRGRGFIVRMVRRSAPYDGDAVGLLGQSFARVMGRGVGASPDLRVAR